MTRIRANCPSCGEIDLRPQDIELHVVRSDAGEVAEGSSYTFACPACTGHIVKPADERIARLLATGGVPVNISSDPPPEVVSRPTHPEAPPSGPPFGYDDLLDLHLLLQREDWLDRLVG
jgi:hypothetical protein